MGLPAMTQQSLNYEFSWSNNLSAGNIIVQSTSEESARATISQKLGMPARWLHLEATHGLNEVIVVTRETNPL
jgi:hypothetical protein